MSSKFVDEVHKLEDEFGDYDTWPTDAVAYIQSVAAELSKQENYVEEDEVRLIDLYQRGFTRRSIARELDKSNTWVARRVRRLIPDYEDDGRTTTPEDLTEFQYYADRGCRPRQIAKNMQRNIDWAVKRYRHLGYH